MKQCILFVDDEASVLEGLRRSLHAYEEQWQLHFAQSAQEALDKIEVLPFDTVVSDVRMPGKDGFALLEQIRSQKRTCDIPVIILTGSQESDLKRRALDLGATDLLNKPVAREDLIARLCSTLRLKAYQDELRIQNASLDQKVQQRTQELEQSRLDIVWRLGRVAEFRDEGTGNHIIRVGYYCRAIAESLGMPARFVEMLSLASPLHDIGKIGIPDRILLKPGKLTVQEWEVMKTHCALGARILQESPHSRMLFYAWHGKQPKHPESLPNPLLDMAATIAMTHHERWDGGGYPQRLEKEIIPIEARIVTVADAYDALCHARPYKPAYPEPCVLEIMQTEVEKQFDPWIYSGFEKARKTLHEIQFQLQEQQTGRSERPPA